LTFPEPKVESEPKEPEGHYGSETEWIEKTVWQRKLRMGWGKKKEKKKGPG